jgi:hypothetical protein
MQRAMSRTVFRKMLVVLACQSALSGIARAAPLPAVGSLVTMDADFFGCRALDDLARIINLDWVKNDKAGAISYGAQHCVALHQGDRLIVQDVSIVQGAVCLKQQPRTQECLWTNAQMLKP